MYILPYVEPSEINYLKYMDTSCSKVMDKNEIVPNIDDKYIYLKTGQLKCTLQNSQGEERIIYFAEKNNFFPMLCNHTNLSITCCFVTNKKSEIIYVPKKNIIKKFNDEELEIFLDEISKKTNILGESLLDLSFYPTKYRLYRFLYEASKTYGKKTEDGILITKKMKYLDIASFIGCHRSNISRYINQLTDCGIMVKTKGYFLIKDLNYIENYLNNY